MIANSFVFRKILFRLLALQVSGVARIRDLGNLQLSGFMLSGLGKSESQLKQDYWVLKNLNMMKSGFFIEVGACDPIYLSNSYHLERDFGWSGILVEPNPEIVNRLKLHRIAKVIDAAVGSLEYVELDLAQDPEFSTISSKENTSVHKLFRGSGRKVSVRCMKLSEICEKNNVPEFFDYLSVDVEGFELEVLKSGDWSKWRPKCISIEHNFSISRRSEIESFMASVGYYRDMSNSKYSWDDFYLRSE
jgi:FkbM family methyltransferase